MILIKHMYFINVCSHQLLPYIQDIIITVFKSYLKCDLYGSYKIRAYHHNSIMLIYLQILQHVFLKQIEPKLKIAV